MRRVLRPWAALCLLSLALSSCRCREAPPARIDLTTTKTVEGTLPRVAPMTLAGDRRPALTASARFPVVVPDRGLLTFAAGVDWAGSGDAPGWYRLVVKLDDAVVTERTLNPRVARQWRDTSVELPAGDHVLSFDLRVTDRDGRDIPTPPGLVVGVGEPVLHDLRGFGRARGVVLVSIDTLRRDHVGAYGYEPPTTPRLDQLAREGLVAEDAVSVSSWTLPAHLSMLTSVDPGRHGGVDTDHGFNKTVPSLAEIMQRAGFRTHAVTSHLYVSSVYGLDAGFEHMDFQQDRKAKDTADRAIDVLDRVGDQPFLLFLHFYDPHWHYDPPREALRHFETSYTGTMSGNWSDFSRRPREQVGAADLAHLLALYDGEIRSTDDELGRVLDHMKRRGLDETTLVVVTSDHGEEFLEHGQWEHQRTLYEEVVRIPLVVKGPGITPRREPEQVSLLDVAPTILEWAGLPAAPTQVGKSLLKPLPAREAYGETLHTTDATDKLFLRAGQQSWKAVVSRPRAGGEPVVEWFDLRSDPGETRSTPPRAELGESIRARALERFDATRRAAPPPPTVCLDAGQQERLRALGYVSGGSACAEPPRE